MTNHPAKRLARWIVPYALYERIERRLFRDPAIVERESQVAAQRALTRANSSLRNVHKGRRCFVLANGPSVNKLDLSLLQGEMVISVSNGYLHPRYRDFRPRYHCVPQISYGKLTESDVVRWFEEMHSRLGDAELFLSASEEPLVTRRGLFPGRKVRYLLLSGTFNETDTSAPDIAREVPGVQSVPVMCLTVAIYMGFERVYLLGTDHDHFLTGEYNYFYEPTVLRGKGLGVDDQGRVLTNRHDDFQALALLWHQYRRARLIGEANGVSIFNATAGGALDEFPRVKFESLFERKQA